MAPYRFKAAVENPTFEWFFHLVDAGVGQNIWARNGLEPECLPTAGTWLQLKERIESGISIGLVNAAEVTLARSHGIPVKSIAGYFGDTTARIFVAADGPIRSPSHLNGRRIGIVSTTHTSYRTVMYMNKRLCIEAEPVPLGTLSSNLSGLRLGEIDAFYSAEGSPLALVESGQLRNLMSLSDIYPQPYTAVVVWASDDLIESNPDLVRKFVTAILETVSYLKCHPDYASELYVKRTGVAKGVADRAVASLNLILTSEGCGSGNDLVAAMAGNWQFIREAGGAPHDVEVDIYDVVDARFLPSQ